MALLKDQRSSPVRHQGHTWLLCRKNDKEGLVEHHSMDDMQRLVLEGAQTKVLKLWRCSTKALDTNCTTHRRDSVHSKARQGSLASYLSDSSSKTGTEKTGSKRGGGSQPGDGSAVSDDDLAEQSRRVSWSMSRLEAALHAGRLNLMSGGRNAGSSGSLEA